MATTKKPTTKKTTTKKVAAKKAAPKKAGLTNDDKRLVWLTVTVLVVFLIYYALMYFK